MAPADLSRFKDNPKTAFLAAEYERLLAEEAEVKELAVGEMGALAADDLARLAEQKASVVTEMERILAAEEKEEEFPNEIVLEVRAGVGG